MAIYKLGEHAPDIHPTAWVAPEATVIGKVTLAEGASVWPGAVLRGDNEPITVGAETNIQEHSVLHTDMGFPLTIGRGCTVGHRAILHGCTVGDNSLIGMGAIVLNGARIGANSLVGAGALVPEGKDFPDGSLIIGTPGRVMRTLTDEQIERLRQSARSYVENWKRFARGFA